MELFSLKGKTALIIGGSKGLGKGMATGLACAGANIVLCSRKQSDLNAAADEIHAKIGAKAIGIAADIKSVDAINRLFDDAEEAFGQVDILINAAGLNLRGPALEFTEEQWDEVQDVQMKYVFFACQAAAKRMIAAGNRGKIINIASLTSQLGLKNMISYCCAKGGVVQMTKALANEWAPYGINVNAIGPGYYETEMTKPLFENKEYLQGLLARIPMDRTGLPEDLMGTAVFLASGASDYITGQVIYVDGGWLAC